MHNTLVRVLSTLGGIGLMGVAGYVNIRYTLDPDMQVVVGALAAGTALAAWAFSLMWHQGRRMLACLALIGILAGEGYSLLATSERLLAGRDARLSQTVTANQPWVLAREALDYAETAAKTECALGRGPKCDAAEKKVDEKRAALTRTEAPRRVNILARSLGWNPEAFDLLPALAGSLALTLLGVVMLTFGHHHHRTPERVGPDDPVVAVLKKAKRPLTNDELARRLQVSKGQASKMVAARADLIRKDRDGRQVSITLH